MHAHPSSLDSILNGAENLFKAFISSLSTYGELIQAALQPKHGKIHEITVDSVSSCPEMTPSIKTNRSRPRPRYCKRVIAFLCWKRKPKSPTLFLHRFGKVFINRSPRHVVHHPKFPPLRNKAQRLFPTIHQTGAKVANFVLGNSWLFGALGWSK